MPIYMPWLTIATAILSVIAIIFANKNPLWVSPVYAGCIIALLILFFSGIIKLPKSILVLSIIPAIIFIYARCRLADCNINYAHNHFNQQIIYTIPPQFDSNKPIDQIRQHIATLHVRYLGFKAGSLLTSMVLGDRAVSLDKNLLDAFRKIGLSHIVAASGFNLTIVTMITYWLLRKLCIQRLIASLIVCSNVFFYASLAGLSASIVRAAIACLLLLFVHFHYRKIHSLAALSIVLLINLIIDPGLVANIGAQLSYAAVTSIIIGVEPLTKVLTFGKDNKIVNLFASAVSVILLAQMSVLPIQLYHFWQASFLFLPANLIIDPLVAPVTIIGFSSSFFGLLDLGQIQLGSLLCQFLDLLVSLPLQLIIYTTESLSSSNLSTISTGQPPLISILFYYLAFIVFLIALVNEKHRLLALIVFFCALLVLFYKTDLKQPVLVFFPNSVIAINTNREAMVIGIENQRAQKLVSFYGATLLKKYSRDNPAKFALYPDKHILLVKQSPENNCFSIITQSPNTTALKTYFIQVGGAQLKHVNSYPAQGCLLSISKFKKLLPNMDIKVSCFHNTITVQSL